MKKSRYQKELDEAKRHHQAGRLAAAEQIYRTILKHEPRNADSLHLLGLLAYQTGAHGAAAELIERSIQYNDSVASYHNSLGAVFSALDKPDAAEKCHRRAIELDATFTEAHSNLGNALVDQGRFADALKSYNRALTLSPNSAQVHANAAAAYAALGEYDRAIEAYQRAVALDPSDVQSLQKIGKLLLAQGRSADAEKIFVHALTIKPDLAELHDDLGFALHVQDKHHEAVASYRRSLALKADANAFNNLGFTLQAQDKVEEALVAYRQAVALKPDFIEAHNNLGNALTDLGDFKSALSHYDQAIALAPNYAEPYFNRAYIKRFQREDADLAALQNLAARAESLPAAHAPGVHFAFAKALDDIGDYEQSFRRLLAGNSLKRGQIAYDEAATANEFRRIAAAFGVDRYKDRSSAGDPSAAPIFVIGMPRSGSTLVEQILGSHPFVEALGELKVLDRAVREGLGIDGYLSLDAKRLTKIGNDYASKLTRLTGGKTRIVDKQLGNFIYAGLIPLILPNARIIHVKRDPVDTCFSCFSKLFQSGHEFTYALSELGRYYGYYDELMAHWKAVLPPGIMLDVTYEDVVENLPEQARRIAAHCGLPWDDGMLQFHTTQRAVRTSSVFQVRQPLFRSSIQRWRRYEAYLGELIGAMPRDA